MTEEEKRLEEARKGKAAWRTWGPYLSERQWGTVREDYSANGDAWNFFPHEHARSRAYRWGEDGLAGISDDKQQLCFAIALWNEKDPILKERLFGLTSSEGNHGEDVKEYYFYVDNVPSHAYMKYLYKYPQRAFPYEQLLEENRKRNRKDFEYELLDTGIFDDNRYFDIFVEYAKESEEEILIKISAANRGPEVATLHLLPTLWFRNTWAWQKGEKKPKLSRDKSAIKAAHPHLGTRWLSFEEPEALLFTENETNKQKLFNVPNDTPYVKDAFHEYVISNNKEVVSHEGTKAALHYVLQIDPGKTSVIKLRLGKSPQRSDAFGQPFEAVFQTRIREADAFYAHITPHAISDDMRSVQRQAFAGLLWNKQVYHYNVEKWIKGDPAGPEPPEERKHKRNGKWKTVDAYDVFSMPDKWEYPWFAAWDLAFHTVALALIDPDFAKTQLLLLTKEWYMHHNGQLPAYEWSFSDVNPPVHAWAAMRVFQIEHKKTGRKDRAFLEKMFHKLSLNFTWWVNRKDNGDRNIFEGGFLGLDNIGVFDRDLGPPPGGIYEQPDGTGWMGMYCLNLLQIALELAREDSVYEHMATKFLEHFVYIADAINNIEGQENGLWKENDGFYHGLLITPDGQHQWVESYTMVGVVPLFAVATSSAKDQSLFPGYRDRFKWFKEHKTELLEQIGDLSQYEKGGNILLSFVNPDKLKRILCRVFDENQFLSPYGIRSVSKYHADHPCTLQSGNKTFTLDYEPAESTTALFGGNSNWRGPIWFPLNYLLIESLQKYDYYLGDALKIEMPSGSGKSVTLWQAASELSYRLIQIFLKDDKGHRPVYGGLKKFQEDPHWRDYILFHEYFHGDNGAGLGASNQTGWTGLVAKLIDQYGEYAVQKKPRRVMEGNVGYI